jgi:hypothetical protein
MEMAPPHTFILSPAISHPVMVPFIPPLELYFPLCIIAGRGLPICTVIGSGAIPTMRFVGWLAKLVGWVAKDRDR